MRERVSLVAEHLNKAICELNRADTAELEEIERDARRAAANGKSLPERLLYSDIAKYCERRLDRIRWRLGS